MAGKRCWSSAVLAGALVLAGSSSAAAHQVTYATPSRPGPPLHVPGAKLRSALHCGPGIRHDARNPILLVPGTDLTPKANYSWNYERAFTARHWAYCAVALPQGATGDIQVAGEYVVYAIRRMARES